MRKITLAFAFVVSMLQLGSAQSVFFELGGPGLASVNFDTRFSSSKTGGIGARAGVGGFSVDGAGVVFVPLAVNYLLGKDDKNYFEIGAGVTPVLGGDGDGDNFSTTFGHLNFGYRLAPAGGGFTFRAFISPVFSGDFFFPYWGGVSFGYQFN